MYDFREWSHKSWIVSALSPRLPNCSFLFFFNDTATTEIYTLSLHDALPIARHRADIQATLTEGLSNGRVEAASTKIRLLTRVAFGFKSPRRSSPWPCSASAASAHPYPAAADTTVSGLQPPARWRSARPQRPRRPRAAGWPAPAWSRGWQGR